VALWFGRCGCPRILQLVYSLRSLQSLQAVSWVLWVWSNTVTVPVCSQFVGVWAAPRLGGIAVRWVGLSGVCQAAHSLQPL
jgi:hypothetical protein